MTINTWYWYVLLRGNIVNRTCGLYTWYKKIYLTFSTMPPRTTTVWEKKNYYGGPQLIGPNIVKKNGQISRFLCSPQVLLTMVPRNRCLGSNPMKLTDQAKLQLVYRFFLVPTTILIVDHQLCQSKTLFLAPPPLNTMPQRNASTFFCISFKQLCTSLTIVADCRRISRTYRCGDLCTHPRGTLFEFALAFAQCCVVVVVVVLLLLLSLGTQPRFGDKSLGIRMVCPQIGTAVLKGLNRVRVRVRFSVENTNPRTTTLYRENGQKHSPLEQHGRGRLIAHRRT